MNPFLQTCLRAAVPDMKPTEAWPLVKACEKAKDPTDLDATSRTLLNQYLPPDLKWAQPLNHV